MEQERCRRVGGALHGGRGFLVAEMAQDRITVGMRSRNILQKVFKKFHFSNHRAIVDQFSPHIIGTAGNEVWASGRMEYDYSRPELAVPDKSRDTREIFLFVRAMLGRTRMIVANDIPGLLRRNRRGEFRRTSEAQTFLFQLRQHFSASSRLTSTGLGGNTGQLVNEPERVGSKSSGASFRRFGLRRVLVSRVNLAAPVTGRFAWRLEEVAPTR